MEVKINKEIRNYTENIYFGLSLRQFFFSVCACITTVILYFIGKKFFGIETISECEHRPQHDLEWLCCRYRGTDERSHPW